MKLSLILSALFLTTNLLAATKSMQCERYRMENGIKTDRTFFSLIYNTDSKEVRYEQKEGKEWLVPNGTEFEVTWNSDDDLRVVCKWIDKTYGSVGKSWHPIYIIDVDFSDPRFEYETFGGFSDFDTIISDPWKFECKRLK